MNRFTKIVSGFFFSLLALGVMGTSPAFTASLQLHQVGNQIVNSAGCTVRLKGVNADSMEYTAMGQGPAGGITAVVAEAITQWGANAIRLPLSQDFWFGCTNSKIGGSPISGANYQAVVASIVSYCLSQNAYVILDLHWSGTQTGPTAPCGTGWGNATGQQYMPDDNSVTFWSSAASIYANNPAVLFDLYNEPFDYNANGWSVWQSGGTGTYGFHTPGMQALLNVVRTVGANNMVVIGGLDYAYDLTGVSGYPITDTGNGIIYSSHIYPFKGSNPWLTTDGDSRVAATAASHPILIGEFGQGSSISNYTPNPDTNGTWDITLMNWIDSHNYSGTAWDMHWNSCPCLLQSDWVTATSYHGVPVQAWLAKPTPPCATPTFTATFTPTITDTPCMIGGTPCTPTLTFTPTATATPTATPSNLYTVYPNPWPDNQNPGDIINFYYKNDQTADQVQLKIFTLAFRKIYEDDTLPAAQGPQPPWSLNLTNLNLSNGLYYFVIIWKNGSQQSQKVMKVLIRR